MYVLTLVSMDVQIPSIFIQYLCKAVQLQCVNIMVWFKSYKIKNTMKWPFTTVPAKIAHDVYMYSDICLLLINFWSVHLMA